MEILNFKGQKFEWIEPPLIFNYEVGVGYSSSDPYETPSYYCDEPLRNVEFYFSIDDVDYLIDFDVNEIEISINKSLIAENEMNLTEAYTLLYDVLEFSGCTHSKINFKND